MLARRNPNVNRAKRNTFVTTESRRARSTRFVKDVVNAAYELVIDVERGLDRLTQYISIDSETGWVSK
jgi:hypothetical protein